MFNLIVILSLFSLSIQTHAAPLAGITTRVSLASDDTQGKTVAADGRCWLEMLRVHYKDGGGVFARCEAKGFALYPHVSKISSITCAKVGAGAGEVAAAVCLCSAWGRRGRWAALVQHFRRGLARAGLVYKFKAKRKRPSISARSAVESLPTRWITLSGSNVNNTGLPAEGGGQARERGWIA